MEDLYAKPELSRKVPAQLRPADADHEDRDSPIYDNRVTQMTTGDVVQEQQTGPAPSVCHTQDRPVHVHDGTICGTAASARVGSGTSVKLLLGLLCLILLVAVVAMGTLCKLLGSSRSLSCT